MKFIFKSPDGATVTAEMPKNAGYQYARVHGYTVISAESTEPEPLTQAEIESIVLDQEYRLTLLENGIIGGDEA